MAWFTTPLTLYAMNAVRWHALDSSSLGKERMRPRWCLVRFFGRNPREPWRGASNLRWDMVQLVFAGLGPLLEMMDGSFQNVAPILGFIGVVKYEMNKRLLACWSLGRLGCYHFQGGGRSFEGRRAPAVAHTCAEGAAWRGVEDLGTSSGEAGAKNPRFTGP